MKKNALFILFLSFFIWTAQANLLIVDSNEDVVQVDNNCTLREAIAAANFDISVDQCGAGLGDDLIWLLLGTSGDAIQLNTQLGIIDGVVIQGPGVDNLVLIPANGHTGHIFQINTDRDVTFKDFRIGGAQSSAVDVVNVRDLNVTNMRFLNNTAGGSGTYGGAIHADLIIGDTQSITELVIDNTEFTANSAGAGGALAISGEYPATMSDVVFTQNSAIIGGGAIYRHNDSRTVFGANLSINTAQFIDNSSNTVGGAIDVDLTFLNIDLALFHDNQGQNVLNISRSISSVQNSLFAENPVQRVIYHRNLSSSTADTELTLSFNTFLDNQNLDVENNPSGSALISYLHANAFDSDIAFSCQGTGFTSLGNNVEKVGNSCSSGNDYPNTDPLLLPLATYGGNLLIAPPSPISPLVDAGTGCSVDDLSGEGRERDGNADGFDDCDIGAIERPDAFLLSLSHAGNGDGQIDLNEFAINCFSPDDCDWPLEQNLTYSLTAVPDVGSQFVQWGGACSGNSNCLVTMNNAQSVTAEFALISTPVTVTLNKFKTESYLAATVESNPTGISCGQTCDFDFEQNETVVLTANPASDTIVDYWDGCDLESVDGLECTVFLGSNPQTIEIYLDKNPDIIFKNTFE